MIYNVLYSENFLRKIKKLNKKYRNIKSDLSKIISDLELNPKIWIDL